MRDVVYFSLWLLVAIVSAIDTYLCVRYADHLVMMEQNPVGQWLLAVNGVPILIAVKFFGTSLALGILFALRRHWTGMSVISGIALFQFLLLVYLSVSA